MILAVSGFHAVVRSVGGCNSTVIHTDADVQTGWNTMHACQVSAFHAAKNQTQSYQHYFFKDSS